MAMSWSDIVDRVSEVISKEGPIPSRDHLRWLANSCISEVSELVKPYYTSWDNSGGGDLTISGYTVDLPDDCLEVTSVEWDGDDNVLDRLGSVADLDRLEPGWRSQAGDPSYYVVDGQSILFNSAPQGTTTGKLTVRGYGRLPSFSDQVGAPNPLTYLSQLRGENLVIYYILAHIPVTVAKAPSDSPASFAYAQTETQLRAARKAEYEQLYKKELDRVISAQRRRKYAPHTY